MITLIHHNGTAVKRVLDASGQAISIKKAVPVAALFELAEKYPDKLLVWCEEQWEESINDLPWHDLIKNDRHLISYACSGKLFIPAAIGLVENSVFLKLKNDVRYPTWVMSSDRGAVYAKTLLQFKDLKTSWRNLNFFLSSLAKTGMSHGLLCYSEPRLHVHQTKLPKFEYNPDLTVLYRFVKTNYKTRWLFLLFFQHWIYEDKIAILPLLKELFWSDNPNGSNSNLNFEFKSVTDKNNNIEVIIPTIGREKYLYQVLKDFKEQAKLPDRVIIVEQNPDEGSISTLDFLKKETWPFAISHTFTHKAGACNARNLALDLIEAEWVFFADDDIRIAPNFLEKTNEFINTGIAEAFTVSCLQKGEKETITNLVQWTTFGTSCSFVKAEHLKNLRFDKAFEGGFGEDVDYGLQLRNKGVDVLYTPFLQLKHLKAPVGGFRKKYEFPWENEKIKPKPSPTIMAFHLKHGAPFQLFGYKTILFLKFYRQQEIKNPFKYLREMQKRWEVSKKWGLRLLGAEVTSTTGAATS